MNKVLMLAVVSMVPVAGMAQVVVPVPPASPAAPAWAPPPPPPPAPTPPPEPDVPTPDIVKRNAAGDIVWPDKPFELVILEGIPIDQEQRKAWDEKWAARLAQQDEAILGNVPKALQIHDAVVDINALTELGQLIALAEPMKAVSASPGLEQFIRTCQVLRPKQLNAFNEGVKHFRAETTKELNEKVGQDKNKLMILKSRESITDRSSESMMAFHRMTAALADNWSKVKGSLNLSGDYGAAEKMAAEAKDPRAKAAAGVALLKVVPAERQGEVLGMFKSPAPAVKTPADPGKQGVEMPKPPVKK